MYLGIVIDAERFLLEKIINVALKYATDVMIVWKSKLRMNQERY